MNRWEVFGLSFVVCLLLGAASAQVPPSFESAGWSVQASGEGDSKSNNTKGDAAHGKEVFDSTCSSCHHADSEETLVGPGLKNLFKWPPHRLSDGTEHKEHTVEIIRNQVVNGGGAMAPMGEYVQGKDLDDLLAYLQTL